MHPKAKKSLLLSCVLGLVGMLSVGLLVPASLQAQVAGATLTGTVTDAQGAAVPNAKVTAQNTATNVSISSTTNAAGAYTIPNLNPGDYQVSTEASGFSTIVSKMTLTVGQKREMNFALKVGQVQQTVEVTSVAPQVDLASSTISGVVQSAQIVQLPLNGRDWASLAQLQPGVASVRTHEQVTQPGGQLRGLGTQMTVDGNRPTQNVYRLNGIIMNDYSNAGPGNVLGANMGVDAIQEFSVLTTNYSGEYGFTSGGVINAVTKSGTNQFHGDAYEFLRNSALDGAEYFENFFGLGKGQFRRNQFGGSLGGPVIKDKIFVFGDYEGLRQSQAVPQVAHILTANARLGIINDNSGNPLPPLAGACPYANSTNLAPGQAAVCVDNTMAQVMAALGRTPTAGAPLLGPANNLQVFAFDGSQVVSDNFGTIRADWNISEKDRLSFSWYRDHSSWSKPDNLNENITGFLVPHQAESLEETHIFSSAFVNSVRLGYNQSNLLSPGLQALVPGATNTAFGIAPGLNAPGTSGFGGFTGIPGFTGWAGFNAKGGFATLSQMYQVYDDAAYTFGNHSLKFGFMFLNDHDNLRNSFGNGSVSFANLPNLLQNIPAQIRMPTVPPFTPLGDPIHHNRANVWAVYVNDDWKILPRLTLNIGLRYEMSTIPTETAGLIGYLPTLWYNADGCVSTASGTVGCGGLRNVTFDSNPTLTNFEPRIGFAWDVFGDGKTSLRGGFGIFDVLPLPYMLGLNALQTAPYNREIDFSNPGQGTYPNQLAAIATQQAIPPASAQRWSYVTPSPKRNYSEQWNLSVQRQVTPSTALTVAYAGSRTRNNPFQSDTLNTVMPYEVNAPGIGRAGSSRGWLFPNPVGSGCAQLGGANDTPCSATDVALGLPSNFSVQPTGIVPGLLINANNVLIQSTAFIGQAWYNSLMIDLERRMSNGFHYGVAFTWQKAEDTSSGSFAGDNYSADITAAIPWWDLNIVKGPADFNVARNLVINTLYNIPTGSLTGPLTYLAKGWQAGGILSLSDGVGMWPLDGLEGDLMGQLNNEPMAIPNLAPGCTPTNLVEHQAVAGVGIQYLKPGCFINATAPSQAFYNAPAPKGCDPAFAYPTCINLLGNLGRNSITGPGFFNIDFSLVKDTYVPKISEAFDVQFRAEFFNVLNHPQFGPPSDNLEPIDASGQPVQGFGVIDSTPFHSREIQFGLKVIF
jgi:Carboxypeptidase regulatory-like domain